MDKSFFQEEMFNLVAFIVTSARGLYDEPADYGIYRLLETAGRLLGILADQGLLEDPFLVHLKEAVDAEREGSMDNDRQRERLDQMVQALASEMQKRLGS